MFEKNLTPQKETRTSNRNTAALSYSRGTPQPAPRAPLAS